MKKDNVRRLTFAAMCVALGVVLPLAFHMVPQGGKVFLPMHIPVLLCGLACGWPFGLACGVLAPLLSCLFTGMPQMAMLPSMLCELATYGLVSGILAQVIHTRPRLLGAYIQLVPAMLAGRVVKGVLEALIFSAGAYSMEAFIASSFVTALPGIAIQLVLLPALVTLLERARVLPTVAAECQ